MTLLVKWSSGNYKNEKYIEFFGVKIKEIDLKISQLKQMKKLLEELSGDIETGNCLVVIPLIVVNNFEYK